MEIINRTHTFRLSMIGATVPTRGEVRPLVLAAALHRFTGH